MECRRNVFHHRKTVLKRISVLELSVLIDDLFKQRVAKAHHRSSIDLRLRRRIMEGLAGIRDDRVLKNPKLACLPMYLQLDSGGARRPMVHAAESGILLHRRGVMVAHALENPIAAQMARSE